MPEPKTVGELIAQMAAAEEAERDAYLEGAASELRRGRLLNARQHIRSAQDHNGRAERLRRLAYAVTRKEGQG